MIGEKVKAIPRGTIIVYNKKGCSGHIPDRSQWNV